MLRGGVVAYATDLKAALLDVDPALLDAAGPVHPDVAAQMARGVRSRLGADLGLATTGVAGPDPQDGHPPGEVHVAVACGRTASGSGPCVWGRPRGGPRREAVRGRPARWAAGNPGRPG